MHMKRPAAHIVQVLAALSLLFLLPSCREKPEENAKFLVNHQETDSDFFLSPEGGEFQLFVVSDLEEWTYSFKVKADWLTIQQQKVNSNSWMLVLTADEYPGDAPRKAVLLFSAGDKTIEVTVLQEPEDAILRVTVPGAYGVDGGSVVFERKTVQMSRLSDGNTFVFSLLFPEEVRVASLQLPDALEEGASVTVRYRLVEKDRTLVNTDYPETRVLRIKEPYVWLKSSDELYFVVKK